MSLREDIALELAKCSYASTDCSYIYKNSLANLMIIAMDYDRYIRQLEDKLNKEEPNEEKQ